MLQRIMSMLGMTPQTMAQNLAQFGNPADIQRAIETGDKKSLSFIEKAARQIQQTKPELYNQVENMFRNGNMR